MLLGTGYVRVCFSHDCKVDYINIGSYGQKCTKEEERQQYDGDFTRILHTKIISENFYSLYFDSDIRSLGWNILQLDLPSDATLQPAVW